MLALDRIKGRREVHAFARMVDVRPQGNYKMSERAKAFVEQWMKNNIYAEPYEDTGTDTRPAEYARDCIIDAKYSGISHIEIEEEFKDLVTYMWEGIEWCERR
jgi:hypothetical protein